MILESPGTVVVGGHNSGQVGRRDGPQSVSAILSIVRKFPPASPGTWQCCSAHLRLGAAKEGEADEKAFRSLNSLIVAEGSASIR